METSARFYLERMRLQVERARRRQFPAASDVPAKWLAYIDGRLKSIEVELETSNSAADSYTLSQRLLTNLFACYEELDHLSRADTSQVADYVVLALLRWFNKTNDGCDYLFTADKEFELDPLLVKADMEVEFHHAHHERAVNELKPIVYRVTMPGGALGSAFHIPLVGHEVGHVLIERFFSELEPLLEKLSGAVPAKSKEAYQRWMQEIIADTICGFVSGPAAFFALHEKLRGKLEPNNDYPDNAMRTRSLWDFTSAKFGDALAARSIRGGQLDSWSVPDDKELGERAASHKNYEQLSRKLISDAGKVRAAAVNLAIKHIPDLEYRSEDLSSDLDMHLKSFLWVIPPFETNGDLPKRSATSLATILNVGWYIAAFQLEELKIKIPEGMDRRGKQLIELDKLMLKSIELSEIRRLWEEEDGERTGQRKAAGASHGKGAGKKARGRTAT
ncbi:hypothetical protein NLM16_16690 [Bradyrhizobium brasilense]|uniref:hypothetical protein n=1 Tax=Bradyrhizobium brasilense TaxID=1419277 RepID=UPI002877C4D3|nr:hypothetical protein [Bradyrhizobium brasilense]MCP3415738.1 hypothetical protein [Bradyrhizobium brasilense]